MGWIGSSKQTTTQTQTPQTPAWMEDYVRSNLDRAQQLASRPYEAYQGDRVAGLDPLEAQARAAAQAQAGQWRPALQTGQALTLMGAMGQGPGVTAPTMRAAQAGPAQQAQSVGAAPTMFASAAQAGPAQQAQSVGAAPTMFATAAQAGPAQQVAAPMRTPVQTAQAVGPVQAQGVQAGATAAGMGAYTDPYQNQVIDQAVRALRRQTDMAQSQLGQRAAAASAFGGSREAILRAEIERNAAEQTGDVVGRLASQGFATSAGLAAADADRRLGADQFSASAFTQAQETGANRILQTSLFNAGAVNQGAEADAQRTLQAALFNAGAVNDQARFNAGNRQQTGLTNAAAFNQAAEAGAGRAQQAGLFNAGAVNDQARFNAGNRQQTGLTNAAAFNQAQEAGAGRTQQTSLFNAGAVNDQARYNASNRQQTGLARAQMGLDAERANQAAFEAEAARQLQAGGMFSQFAGDQQRLGAADTAQLATLGGLGRGVTQAGLDADYEAFLRAQTDPERQLQMLLAAASGQPLGMFVGQTTSGTTKGGNPNQDLQTLGSAIQAGATLAGMFSDRRLKTDVARLGVDARGVAWWAYRYLWDPPGARRVGVMAQELLAHPTLRAAVRKVGGYLVVDYAQLGGAS